MKKQIETETPRLLLRRWKEEDLEPFIKMNADAEVMRYFPAVRNEEQTMEFYNRIKQEFEQLGYGLYAAEEKSSGDFIGFIGFHGADIEVPFCPCVEIGWRLNKKYWNQGYATEGAKACLKYGFEKLGFDKVYSFTSTTNLPSQRVMQKISLKIERYFEHPNVEAGNPLKPHVCYWITREDYCN